MPPQRPAWDFSVSDGLPGFPTNYLQTASRRAIEVRDDGVLLIKPDRVTKRMLQHGRILG